MIEKKFNKPHGQKKISLKTWVKFIMPLLIILSILCAIFLVAGINL